ncbi:hypothetical protein A7X12_22540 [Sphingomonas sp. TDK1]|nr:hypothetical protein A7X12_22540 [Sphingomonas sp. TDK1]
MHWYLNNVVRRRLNAIDWTIVRPGANGVIPDAHGQSVVGRARIAFLMRRTAEGCVEQHAVETA